MKQRLALARALLTDAPVLLLDEPTKALDPQKQSQVRQFIRRTLVDELGRTVLLVTHSLAEAQPPATAWCCCGKAGWRASALRTRS